MARKKKEEERTEIQRVDTRESVRVVTHNTFVTCRGIDTLSLKARKLLYIAVAQCRIKDTDFSEFEITVKEFANLMQIEPSHVYREADAITDELMRLIIRTEKPNKRGFHKGHVFDTCDYEEDSYIHFKISDDMKKLLLGLKGDFTQPPLKDFLRMRSSYSMAIWHLFQIEMNSSKPSFYDTWEFEFSLDELREVTGTQEKLLPIGNFKSKVLDVAIREIRDNCGVDIKYTDVKRGRHIVGFNFIAQNLMHIDVDTLPPEVLEKAKRILELQARGLL